MLNVYNQRPVSIFLHEGCGKIVIKFCNIKMQLKMCQFKLFNNYLANISKTISADTTQVELLLVKNNLTVKVSLNNFLQLMHGVRSVVQKEFNIKN